MDLFICPGYAYETRISEKQCQYLKAQPDDIPYSSRGERRPKACSTCSRDGHMEELETKKCTECGTELMHNGKSVLCKRCYTKIWARNKKKAKVSVEEATNQLFKPTEDFIPISEISKHSKPDCSITLTLSFPDKCKHILDLLKSDADDQLRTVEHQVIWVLKKYYETELGDG